MTHFTAHFRLRCSFKTQVLIKMSLHFATLILPHVLATRCYWKHFIWECYVHLMHPTCLLCGIHLIATTLNPFMPPFYTSKYLNWHVLTYFLCCIFGMIFRLVWKPETAKSEFFFFPSFLFLLFFFFVFLLALPFWFKYHIPFLTIDPPKSHIVDLKYISISFDVGKYNIYIFHTFCIISV